VDKDPHRIYCRSSPGTDLLSKMTSSAITFTVRCDRQWEIGRSTMTGFCYRNKTQILPLNRKPGIFLSCTFLRGIHKPLYVKLYYVLWLFVSHLTQKAIQRRSPTWQAGEKKGHQTT